MNIQIFSVIMAGGGGTRFWPISRQVNPKQLLNLSGNDALINETINRISNLSEQDNIYIVTNQQQGEPLKEVVGDKCRDENILLEPAARNTAACIGYAAFKIMKKHGDGIMCVFPADHYIKDQESFTKVLQLAIQTAETEDKLVTIGITPTFPSTGYGYINYNPEDGSNGHFNVLDFVEKPNYDKANQYIKSGKYLWNSGMFVWKVSTILKNFDRFLPKLYKQLEELSNYLETPDEREKVQDIYPTLQSISVDYGIMERSDEVLVIPGSFGWNDVGSWDSLGAIFLWMKTEILYAGKHFD